MKRFTTFIVENAHFTILLTLIMVLLGVFSISKIKISQDPMVEFPELFMTMTLPGASPSELQKSVVLPIEEDLKALEDLNKIETTIKNGFAYSTIRFEYGVDVDEKERRVTSTLNNLKAELPSELETHVKQSSISDYIAPFVFAVVSDTATMEEIDRVSDKLKKRLTRVRGFVNVEVMRAGQEVHVFMDPNRLALHGLTLDAVIESLKSENTFLPTGIIPFDSQEIQLMPPAGGYKSVDEIKNTLLITPRGNRLPLKAVADIAKTWELNNIVSRTNGLKCRFVTMNATARANILNLKKAVERILKELRGEIRPEISIEVLYDQETGVRQKLSDLTSNLNQGILILCVVLLFSVGYRSGFVIALMLPMALIFSITLLSFTDYGIQQISIAGFIIALGLIVDNGIVVTENAYILMTYKGKALKDAVIEGTASVIKPLISSTFTTVLAFAPLFLLTTDEGLFLRSLSVTIWIALGCSLFISITFSTLLLSRIGTENKLWKLPSPPSFLIALIPFRDKWYRKGIFWVLWHPIISALVPIVLLAATLMVATTLDVIVFPESDDPYFTIAVEPPADTSQAETEKTLALVEARLRNFEEVIRVSSIIGERFPMANVGIERARRGRTNATMFVEVNFRDSHRLARLTGRIDEAIDDLRRRAMIRVSPFKVGGSAAKHPIILDVAGEDISELRALASSLAKRIRTMPGVKLVDNPARSEQFAVGIEIDRQKAALAGLAKPHLDPIISMLTYGLKIDEFRDERNEEIPILLKIPINPAAPMHIFNRVLVRSPSRGHIPLGHVVKAVFREPDFEINHIDFQPTVQIGVDVMDKKDLARVEKNLQKMLFESGDLIGNHTVTIGGQQKDKAKAFAGFGEFSAIIAVVIFAIFVLQFKSFTQPMIIYTSIPLCLIGALSALYVTGQPISFVAFVGVTSLMGIVVNDSILLVDEGNQLLASESFRSVVDAAAEAGRNRFMPILLTSVTTIMALIPMALGKTMFKPMAIVLIGGLFSSTFITLLITPLLFSKFSRNRID
jgi:multidrug efflux pump subunit AcrB